MEKYSSGSRGSPAKGLGWIKPVRGFESLLLRQSKDCGIYSIVFFSIIIYYSSKTSNFFATMPVELACTNNVTTIHIKTVEEIIS